MRSYFLSFAANGDRRVLPKQQVYLQYKSAGFAISLSRRSEWSLNIAFKNTKGK
jgi:hypothetical protein